MLPTFHLEGKKVIVTGGGRGIGRALAVGMAEAGADVAVMSRTDHELNETIRLIEKVGGKALKLTGDITKRSHVEKAIERVKKTFGSVDILINNAGMNIRTPAMEVTDEEWEKIMETNLHGAFMMSQEAARVMRNNGQGKIINITSVAGHVALRTGVVYAATKAALIQMTKTLALEWSSYGININAVGPWYFRTPLTEKLLSDEDYLNAILAQTPMKRVGELEELVGPVVFLASEASNYMTGQTLFVDGGMTIYGF